MATFKEYIFTNYKRRDGTYNIKIRITHNRKSRYIPTPFYVAPDQITRTGKIRDMVIADKIDEKIKELRDAVITIGFVSDSLDVDQLISLMDKITETGNFIEFCQNKIDELKKNPKKKRTSEAYQTDLNCLKKYNESDNLPFSLMTKAYVRGFYDWLLKTHAVRTSNNTMMHISSFYNAARRELNDEEAGVSIVKYHCFEGLEYRKPEEHEANAFETIEEMQAVIDCPYTGYKSYDFAKDMFVLCFVLNGINMKDISGLLKSQYKDGILTYRRSKVSERMGLESETKVKLNDVAVAIINKYSGDKRYLIKYNRRAHEAETNKYIHKIFKLAGVEEDDSKKGERYTFNTARHSMATFSRNLCGVSREVVNQMLVHKNNDKMETTDWYIKRSFVEMWEANEKLMKLFDWSFYLGKKRG